MWRGRAGVADEEVQEAARESSEHEEEHEDMLLVRQAGTLHRRLPGEGREQGWLQAQVKNGWQVPVKPRIFMENPNPCTIAIVPGSAAIAYRTSHR
jgi:hypothetical protein